ncbi:hypothetical protein Bbelb_206000 [Branchiostoma belcheri]|nr:hypothetical protein Bbelb_206000 [Branchiostoma belcheri]
MEQQIPDVANKLELIPTNPCGKTARHKYGVENDESRGVGHHRHHQQGESQSLGCQQGIENVGNSPCDGTGKGLGHFESNGYFCTQCFNPFLWQPGPMLGLISFCTHADNWNCAQRGLNFAATPNTIPATDMVTETKSTIHRTCIPQKQTKAMRAKGAKTLKMPQPQPASHSGCHQSKLKHLANNQET